MSGHLEQAAGILKTAGQQTPVEHVQAASEQLATVIQHIQMVGGPIGESLTNEAMATHLEVQGIAARLQALRERLESAADTVLRGGS